MKPTRYVKIANQRHGPPSSLRIFLFFVFPRTILRDDTPAIYKRKEDYPEDRSLQQNAETGSLSQTSRRSTGTMKDRSRTGDVQQRQQEEVRPRAQECIIITIDGGLETPFKILTDSLGSGRGRTGGGRRVCQTHWVVTRPSEGSGVWRKGPRQRRVPSRAQLEGGRVERRQFGDSDRMERQVQP
jgi:hypothetical protein